MLKTTIFFTLLISLGANAQTRAQCRSDGHKTLLPSFELELSDTTAKIQADRGAGSAEFSGNLKSTARPNSGKLIYFGFDHLLAEYEVTLSVPVKALQEKEFSVRIYGRGEALILEDYDCVVSN